MFIQNQKAKCFYISSPVCHDTIVQLACVKHTISVHPEPGSNSNINNFNLFTLNVKNSQIKNLIIN